jgi:hypothetical protein
MKIKNNNQVKLVDKQLKVYHDFYVPNAFADISVADRKGVKSLVVEIEASHSGIINGNHFFYLPKGMENGIETFVKPFPKPVLVNHDSRTDPIGRVYDSKYIDYNLSPGMLRDYNNPTDVIEHVMDFVKGPIFNGSTEYKGLGHLELKSEITDTDAIQKILDKRYLTVSIGGTCKDVTCSRCGANIKDEMMDIQNGIDKPESDCAHELGLKYSDSEPSLFFIAGDMDFDELSYVTSPADPNAVARVANSRNKDSNSFTVCDMKTSTEGTKIHIHLTTKDSKQESTKEMKTKLKDFLSKPEDALALVKKVLKDMGLTKHIVSDERYAKMRATSYLFADVKVLPIHDKAHILAAYKILADLEDEEGKTLTSATGTLDAKAKRLFGDEYKFEEVLADLVKASTEPGNTTDAKTPAQIAAEEVAAATATAAAAEALAAGKVQDDKLSVVVDYEKLAALIVPQITNFIQKEHQSYDFLLKRVNLLETELEDTLNKENEMTDQIKTIIIDHILTIDKNEKPDELKTRSLDSLNDKLKDLKLKASTTTPTATAVTDASKITTTTVTVADGASKKEETSTTTATTAATTTTQVSAVEFLDSKVVSVEYKKILKAEGLVAAGKYLDELRKTNKVHKGFRLM